MGFNVQLLDMQLLMCINGVQIVINNNVIINGLTMWEMKKILKWSPCYNPSWKYN